MTVPLVLLIEDDATQRLIARTALGKSGHGVIEAQDGTTGLAMARAHKPDLIVCDVVMPGIDGYEVVARLREDSAVADIPVVMLTSLAERADMRRGMVAGADDYLAKPFGADELRDAVEAALHKRRVRREQVVNDLKPKLLAVLEGQKQSLAREYEIRLMKELNTRWSQGGDTPARTDYPDAVLLRVDVVAGVHQPPGGSEEDYRNAVLRAFQAARDTLYLFGARQLLPYGDDVLAVFAPEAGTDGAAVRTNALRAAIALAKAAAMATPGAGRAAEGITIALHQGPVTLLKMKDPLHGDPDSILATGEGGATVALLQEFARGSGWRIACSAPLAAHLHGQAIPVRQGQLALKDGQQLAAVELLAVG
jgi:CheY-like chemotaxis protein